MVLPVAPINLTIASGKSSVTKNVVVKVLNADVLNAEPMGHTIQLTATSDCPAAVTVGTPDLGTTTDADHDTVTLTGGKSRAANVLVTVSSAIGSFNKKAPHRCTLTFTATAAAPSSGPDPNPSNNTMTAELNVIDKNDTPGTAVHESVIKSVSPFTLTSAKMKSVAAKTVPVTVGNADLLQPTEPALLHSIAVASTGTCSGLGVGVVDFGGKSIGDQSSVPVKGGSTKLGKLPITADSATITTPNKLSPQRCVVTLTATGPTDPDPDPTNNRTRLTVDLVDRNDGP